MELSGARILSLFLMCGAEFAIWVLLCLFVMAVMSVVQFIRKKKLTLRMINMVAYATFGFLLFILLEIVYYTMFWFLRFSISLLLCLIVTLITAAIQFINKKIRRKQPIRRVVKLFGYAAFYVITFLIVYKVLEPYPAEWFAINKEYRTLAYELYNATLERYEYSNIYKGDHGEIIISVEDNNYDLPNGSQDRTVKQRDHIAIKNAVEEYFKRNGGFQEERIEIEILDADHRHSWEHAGYIYNFNPLTGEMGADVPYWFITGVDANDCTELAEFYQGFSGINCTVRSMEGVQELTNLSSLVYLELNGVEEGLEGRYLEEISALLPSCKIYINQYDNHYHSNLFPAWKEFESE